MDIRYQTPDMGTIWAPQTRNRIERELWVAIMRAQAEAGVPIPADHIQDYEHAIEIIIDFGDELEAIRGIEAKTGHDLYARLQYFNAMAGHEDAHLGMTSADIVENAQQVQILRSGELLLRHAEQLLARLAQLAQAEKTRPMVARTHGQPAQVTTIGKRVLDWIGELVLGVEALQSALHFYHPRGLGGAVGTRADLAALLHRHRSDPDAGDVDALGRAEDLDESFGLWTLDGNEPDPLGSTGQCYPRGMDLPIVSAAVQLAAACNTVCTNIRLWAVLGHANESRTPEQVGSSAMPHKTNPRYSERVHSLAIVARGYANMLEQFAGGMWFEGDVSTSAGRRIALPGLFHTVDSVLANTAYVLDRLEFNRNAIAEDVRRYRPLLATGRLLEACVAGGMDRSAAHKLIKDHVDWVMTLETPHALVARMADDSAVPLTFAEIEELLDVQKLAEPAAYMVDRALPGLDGGLEVDEEWPGQIL